MREYQFPEKKTSIGYVDTLSRCCEPSDEDAHRNLRLRALQPTGCSRSTNRHAMLPPKFKEAEIESAALVPVGIF